MEFHPDKNPGDHTAEVKFKEINEAYDVLKDDQKRAAYDRFGHAAFEARHGRARAAAVRSISPAASRDVFEDLFGELMGGTQRRGAAIAARICATISRSRWKKPSAAAAPRSRCRPRSPAKPAAARARKPATSPRPVPTCAGHGKVRATQGFFTIERTCSALPRQRQDHPQSLQDLPRRGPWCRRNAPSTSMCRPVSRKAPASACPAKARRALNGGPPGDLYIFLSVAEHPIFQRDGHDLHCRAPVSFVTAALGGAIEVPTLDGGRAKVTIPEGTQPGRQFRLRGQGHAGAAQRPAWRRSLCRGGGRDPGQADQAAEGIAARVRRRERRPAPIRRPKASWPS